MRIVGRWNELASYGPLAIQFGKANPVSVESLTHLVDLVVAEGQRGQSIQRYKGLGEMNPEQLWETTMDETRRTLRRVELGDIEDADQAFDVLMGDDVERRREFIEENALRVRNLDV